MMTSSDGAPGAGELRKLAEELGLDWISSIEVESLDPELVSRAPFQFAKTNLILPLRMERGRLIAATARPLNIEAQDDLRLVYGAPVELVVAETGTLQDAINRAYDLSADSAHETMDDIQEDEDLDSLVSAMPGDLLETSDEAPVIRLLNSVLVQAVKEKASDIHIEPYERGLASCSVAG